MAYTLIGKDFTPPDVRAKVTGRAKYAEDIRAEGMGFARLLTSPVPHGRVNNIDASEALATFSVPPGLRVELVAAEPLVIAPVAHQITAAAELGADAVELHTGAYAEAARRHQGDMERNELQKLCITAHQIVQCGLGLHAGHGLTYRNVRPVAEIPAMHELNIGHSIIARALMVGLEQAVRDMKKLIG